MAEPVDRPVQFGLVEWALLAIVALLWGSSFLLIEIGLEDLEPAAVAWLRLVFGAAALACLPAAWRPIHREDRGLVAVLGLVWMAGPFLLFPLAQQSTTSSLAGMINGASPLFTLAIATWWFRSAPTRAQLTGLLLGFGGVLAVSWPVTQDGGASVLGAGLVLLATMSYGVAFNLAAPLQRRNGALPVIWRAQLVALVLVAPPGLVGLTGSSPSWSSLTVMVALGALSTGVAFATFTTLVGRVGAPSGSVAVYFVPVVALLLGVVVGGEVVTAIAVVGTGLVVAGAYLTGRGNRQGAAASRPGRANGGRAGSLRR